MGWVEPAWGVARENLEYRPVVGNGGNGDMGREWGRRRRKSGGKEKIFFGRKIFYTTEKCTLWVRQSDMADKSYMGEPVEACRRFLVRFLIWSC